MRKARAVKDGEGGGLYIGECAIALEAAVGQKV